jgi:hypothetical protein
MHSVRRQGIVLRFDLYLGWSPGACTCPANLLSSRPIVKLNQPHSGEMFIGSRAHDS